MHGLHEISEKTRWPIPDINSSADQECQAMALIGRQYKKLLGYTVSK